MVETLRKLFGRKLRKIRDDHSLTRDQLAEYVDTTGSTVYRLEAGEVWIGSELLERFARHFRVSPAYFFEDQTPKVSPQEAWEIVGEALQQGSTQPKLLKAAEPSLKLPPEKEKLLASVVSAVSDAQDETFEILARSLRAVVAAVPRGDKADPVLDLGKEIKQLSKRHLKAK